MAILIDAYNISRVQGTGVATYGRTLAKAATALGHEVHLLYGTRAGHARQPLLNEIALAEGEEAAASGFRQIGIPRQVATAISGIVATRNAREINLSGEVIMPTPLCDELSGMRYWNAPRLYSLSQKAFRITGRMSNVKVCDIDIAHWTYPLPIKMSGAVNIYTIHDLVPLRMPYTTSDQKKHYLSLCQSIAREADHILTVSEHSRADIIRILGVKENRVTNLYQTTDLEEILNLLTTEQIEIEIDGLLNLEMRGYYLFFGAIEPKKNIARIIEAYLTSGARHPLVIVGAPGWGSNRDLTLLKQISELDGKKRIKWLGYLPRRTLATVIAGARAVLFPSLYEGFGLPVLEAMALGTPIITSNSSSLPEIAGDAGILVDPLNVRAIAGAIQQIDSDDRTVESLSKAGLSRAKYFSTSNYIARLSAFYASFGL